ncbi:hypothetical protein ACN47E_004363 [Coniothyrium glycines]
MSFKAKDLQFDKSQPAFLQRLRGQLAGDDSARHERPIPRNKRLKQDDEDDAPAYVIEDTNQSLSKEEYEAMVAGKDSTESNHDDRDKPADGRQEAVVTANSSTKDKIAGIGTNTKKRKVAKVISNDGDEKAGPKDDEKPSAKTVKKSKKQTKAVKLAFRDDLDV